MVIAFVIGYSLASIFTVIFGCTPIAKFWDITITHGSCINFPAFYFSYLGLNIGTDIAILILPVPLLLKLHMPRRQKLWLGVIFMTGILYAGLYPI